MRAHITGLRLSVGVVVGGLILTGCTGSVDGAAEPDQAAAAPVQTSDPALTTVPPDQVIDPRDPDEGATPVDTLVNPEAYRNDELNAYLWRSPTGNIRCELLQVPDVALSCTVLEHSLTPAPGCTADQPVTVTISRGELVQGCRGDAAPEGPVLDYGDTIDLDNFSCSSAEDGMSCAAGTQSFRISRAGLDLQG